MWFVEISNKLLGLRGCQVAPRVDGEVWVIAFVGVKWGDLCHGTRGIVVCELTELEELVPVVLLVVTVDLDILLQGLCEGDTETRPLIYRDSLRQGEPNRCDTLTQW